MPMSKKTYEIEKGSLKQLFHHIDREMRRSKNIKKPEQGFSESLARKAEQDLRHYDKSAKAVLLKRRFLQIYPFKINLRYGIKYVFDTVKDVYKNYAQRCDAGKVLKVFFREMAIMLTSGISVIPALDIAKVHAESGRFKEVLERVVYELKAHGVSLSSALERFPNYFSKLYVCVIKAGEKSCNLPLIFEELACLEDRSEFLKNKLKSALVYPAAISILSLGILYILAKMLVPALLALGSAVDAAQIRGIAKFVIYMAGVFSYPLTTYVIVGVVLFVVFLIYSYFKTPEGKYAWDKFKFQMPVIGDALIKVSVIQFCVILHVLYKSGVPILQSTKILSEIFENAYVKSKIEEVVFPRVNHGYNLSYGLKKLGFFPPVAIQLISTGEETGRLVELLQKLIEIYKMEVEDSLIRLSNILEPLIIIAFGGLVFFIALISMLPVYQVISVM